MDEAVIERLEESFAMLAPRGQEVAARFYAHLFATQPRLGAPVARIVPAPGPQLLHLWHPREVRFLECGRLLS